MRTVLILFLLTASTAGADTLVAARTIRSQSILTPADLTLIDGATAGALSRPDDAIGMETRVILYAGRPVRPGDLGPPAIIERNQIVTLRYQRGGLAIMTEARALGRAGVGDMLRVMNLSSRSTVSGRVTARGDVAVGTRLQY